MIILFTLTCVFTLLYILFILVLIILLILVYQICSCHDYPAHFDMRVHFVVYLVCLSVDYLDHLWACYPHYYSSWLLYFLLSLCVDLDDIPVVCLTTCYMTSLLLHDACVACLCGSHTYPLISNSLVLVELVSFDLVFDMRLVVLFALRPHYWFGVRSSNGLYLCLGAFWRWPTHWCWLESDLWRLV